MLRGSFGRTSSLLMECGVRDFCMVNYLILAYNNSLIDFESD